MRAHRSPRYRYPGEVPALIGAVVIAAIVIAYLVAGSIVRDGRTADKLRHDSPAASLIAEDDPGWDCETMGNRMCGPDGEPLGARLQDTAGPSWEVIYDPATHTYHVEPETQEVSQ